MNLKLNRRELLLSLVGLGATIAFTSPLSQANDLQIDGVWDALTKDPWYFEVNDYGTIVESGSRLHEISVPAARYSDLSAVLSWQSKQPTAEF